MFAGGVGRIFREFDEFLDITYDKRQSAVEATIWKKKNRKKLTNLLENFLEETACLLNIDRADFANGELPWGLIFYNRMLSTKNLVNVERHALYVESFGDYAEFYKDCKPKEFKKKKSFVNSVNTLVHYLKLHHVDPDNVLIGLTPSTNVLERYEEWLQLPNDHKSQAQHLSNTEGNTDPLALYFVGYPAKKGDIVIAQVPIEKVGSRDLRLRTLQNQQRKTVIQYARIKEAVEFNKKTFLTIWIAPKEEKEITVPAEHCVPIRKLVPGQAWIGDVRRMRDIVADPYMEFQAGLFSELVCILDTKLHEFDIPVQKIYTALQHQPVPFLYYHRVKALTPIVDELVKLSDSSCFPQIENIRTSFLSESIATTNSELSKLITEINDPDGSSNKLFMPTCDEDLMKLNTLQPEDIVNEFILKFQKYLHSAVAAFESEKGELLKGNLKNQLSKWWCLLIETRSELVLAQTKYDPHACNVDNYIDEPPANLEVVRDNLIVVQEILNPKHPSHEIVTEATEDIKNEVYPVIDDFIMKAHVVLSYDLLGEEINLEYSPDSFNLEKTREAFTQQKEKILAMDNGEEYYKQLDGLMKDLNYLVAMKDLEYQTTIDRESSTGAKLELSYAVPLSGLVMGSFFRLENILKTVLELWAPKAMVIPTLVSKNPPGSEGGVVPKITPPEPQSPKFNSAPTTPIGERSTEGKKLRAEKNNERKVSTPSLSAAPKRKRKKTPRGSDSDSTPRRRKKRVDENGNPIERKKRANDERNSIERKKRLDDEVTSAPVDSKKMRRSRSQKIIASDCIFRPQEFPVDLQKKDPDVTPRRKKRRKKVKETPQVDEAENSLAGADQPTTPAVGFTAEQE